MSEENIYIKRLIRNYIKYNDKGSFKEFYDIYYAKLVHFATIFSKDIISAQEIVSDVFYKILKNPRLLEKAFDIDNYLFLAVKNQAFTHYKKAKFTHAFRPIEDVQDYLIKANETPEEIYIQSELYDILKEEIEKMPPKRRMIFIMIKEDGMKYREVAELFDISQKTVETHMLEAIKQIKKCIREYIESKDIKIRNIKYWKNLSIFFI